MFLNLYLKRKERETSREVPQSQTGTLPRPQSSVKYGFRYNLLQECIQTDVIFLYQRTVSAIKFRKRRTKKKLIEKSRECQITNRSHSHTPRGRGNRENQTSANQTTVRNALRLALYSQSKIIAMLKGLKNARTK